MSPLSVKFKSECDNFMEFQAYVSALTGGAFFFRRAVMVTLLISVRAARHARSPMLRKDRLVHERTFHLC